LSRCAPRTQASQMTVPYNGKASTCLKRSSQGPGRGSWRRQPGKHASRTYGDAMPMPSATKITSIVAADPASAKPSAAPMNGAVHGDATTTASTPEPNASRVRFFEVQLVTPEGASCVNSKTPDKLSASTKNKIAS